MINLFAFTASRLAYPEFISVNRLTSALNRIQIIVRSKPSDDVGDTAQIDLTMKQARELGRILSAVGSNPDLVTTQNFSKNFEAVWDVVKDWDLKTPSEHSYHGATGDQVRAILAALKLK